MAAPDEALKAQLASWFATIDPTMQEVLKTIYAEAPAAVSKAISGGAWVAEDGDPPLEDVVGGGQAGGFANSRYTVEPWPLTVGATAKVTMGFISMAGQPGFRTEVKIVDPRGDETTHTLTGDALAAGGEAIQEFTIENVIEGYYQVELDVNPDGAPQGEPPNSNGSQLLMPNMGFDVMSEEGGADRQDSSAFSQGAAYLASLITQPDGRNAAGIMPDALNYLASIENLSGDESSVLASLGGKVGYMDEATGERVPTLAEVLTAIGVAAQQSQTRPTREEEDRKPLFDTLRALDAII